jgi:predicted GTPase
LLGTSFPDKIKELTVEVEVIAKLQVINPFDYFVEEYAEEFPFTYDQMLQQNCVSKFKLKESPIFLKFIEGLKLNNQYPLMIF